PALPEKRNSADERVRARPRTFGCGRVVDSAVHLDAVVELLFRAPRPRLLNFRKRLVDERLTPEARIHRHDQQAINLLEEWQHMADGRGWVDGQAGFLPQRLDLPQQRRDLL